MQSTAALLVGLLQPQLQLQYYRSSSRDSAWRGLRFLRSTAGIPEYRVVAGAGGASPAPRPAPAGLGVHARPIPRPCTRSLSRAAPLETRARANPRHRRASVPWGVDCRVWAAARCFRVSNLPLKLQRCYYESFFKGTSTYHKGTSTFHPKTTANTTWRPANTQRGPQRRVPFDWR